MKHSCRARFSCQAISLVPLICRCVQESGTSVQGTSKSDLAGNKENMSVGSIGIAVPWGPSRGEERIAAGTGQPQSTHPHRQLLCLRNFGSFFPPTKWQQRPEKSMTDQRTSRLLFFLGFPTTTTRKSPVLGPKVIKHGKK